MVDEKDVAKVGKEDLLLIHSTLFRASQLFQCSPCFEDYRELGVLPTHTELPKYKHKDAIIRLAENLNALLQTAIYLQSHQLAVEKRVIDKFSGNRRRNNSNSPQSYVQCMW